MRESLDPGLKAGDLRSKPSYPMPTVVEVLEAADEIVTFRQPGKRKKHTWPRDQFEQTFHREEGLRR